MDDALSYSLAINTLLLNVNNNLQRQCVWMFLSKNNVISITKTHKDEPSKTSSCSNDTRSGWRCSWNDNLYCC